MHQQIPPHERLDAILGSEHLTTDQAVEAMSAQYRENQATFPHAMLTTVLAQASPFDDDARVPILRYVGPFRDRRTAESWAAEQFT